MDKYDWRAAQFEANRTRRRYVVAYRMLSSLSEADDAVQDVFAPSRSALREAPSRA